MALIYRLCSRAWPWVVTTVTLHPRTATASSLQMRIMIHSGNNKHAVGFVNSCICPIGCPLLQHRPGPSPLKSWGGLLAAALGSSESESMEDGEDGWIKA